MKCKIYQAYEKIGNRWIICPSTIPRSRKSGKFSIRRVTNRKAKKYLITGCMSR